MLKKIFRWFAGPTKSKRLVLVASGNWTINWSDAAPDKGVWLLYESESGRRDFETNYVPWVYKHTGGIKRLPGHGPLSLWESGGPLPEFCTRIKKDA